LAASFSLMMHWHVLIRLPTTAGRTLDDTVGISQRS
jgi:hypothetical protein